LGLFEKAAPQFYWSMKKIIICFILVTSSLLGRSQISGATLQASGLTCALCAKSIFTNLSSLSFVENVDTDLNASSFLITFKKGQQINPDLLKKKVEDAGFSVSNLLLDFNADNLIVNPDVLLNIGDIHYHLVNSKGKGLNGLVKLQVIDKGYVGIKENKKLLTSVKQACYQTADVADCPNPGTSKSIPSFHVLVK
jgi:copper chaperone CopZ